MNKQLTENVPESHVDVDQNDTGVLPGISLTPYGIKDIELGLPSQALHNGDGKADIVMVNGVALNKATEAVAIGCNNVFVGYPDNVNPTYINGAGVTINDTGISVVNNTHLKSTLTDIQATSRLERPHNSSAFGSISDVTTSNFTNYETIESIRRSLEIIIERAKDNGIVCGIDIVSKKPYAMSNYDMVPHVRKEFTR